MLLSATVCEKKTDRAPILFTGGLVAGIRQAARLGFAAVELHMKDTAGVDPGLVKDTLRDSDIALSSIGTGMAHTDDGLSLCSEREAVRRRAVEVVKTLVDAFSELRPRIILGLLRGRLGEASDRAKGESRLREALQECCRYAAAKHVTLVLECINRYEMDYLNRVEEVAGLIDRIGADNLKAHVDTFHMNIEEQSIELTLLRYRDYIGHVHFADNNRRYPGAGMIDFKSVLRSLRLAGYEGYIALECLPWPDGETAARRALTYLNGLEPEASLQP
jgi:sugar phosphate isomerase/epimerase